MTNLEQYNHFKELRENFDVFGNLKEKKGKYQYSFTVDTKGIDRDEIDRILLDRSFEMAIWSDIYGHIYKKLSEQEEYYKKKIVRGLGDNKE